MNRALVVMTTDGEDDVEGGEDLYGGEVVM
jgi:hypothetical protein